MESHFSRPGPRSNRLMGTSVTRPRFVALPCTNERQELRDPCDRNGVGLQRLRQKLLKPRSLDVRVASLLPLRCPQSLSLSLSLFTFLHQLSEFVTIGWYIPSSRISVSLTDLSKQNAGIHLYLSLHSSIRVEGSASNLTKMFGFNFSSW